MADPIAALEKCLIKLSKAEVSRRCGVSPGYLFLVLQRQRPPSDKILEFVNMERIPVSYKLRRKRQTQ